jgi:hypothetical protein
MKLYHLCRLRNRRELHQAPLLLILPIPITRGTRVRRKINLSPLWIPLSSPQQRTDSSVLRVVVKVFVQSAPKHEIRASPIERDQTSSTSIHEVSWLFTTVCITSGKNGEHIRVTVIPVNPCLLNKNLKATRQNKVSIDRCSGHVGMWPGGTALDSCAGGRAFESP